MHGRPRATQRLDPTRQKHEEAKISRFQSLLEEVLHNHRHRKFCEQALLQNSKLLETNPEVYTAWNYRKLAVTHLLQDEHDEAARKSVLDKELSVIERALLRNHKSYGAWHHRKWVISFGLSSLDHEYRLLDKLLTLDARNFHGWNYRRFLARINKPTEEEELRYTTKMINENFSNYSAWHNRSVLLSKQLAEHRIQKDEWQKVIAEEYDFVNASFFTEPNDQSGWFYLMWLLSHTVIPSGPSLAGCLPFDGSSVLWNSDKPFNSSFWSLTFTSSKNIYCNVCAPLLVLIFNKPVLGVDTTTVSIKSTPEAPCLGSGFSWTPQSKNAGGSQIWTADMRDLRVGFEGGLHTVQVDVGVSPGIFSKDGPFIGVNQFNFSLELRDFSGAAYKQPLAQEACIAWPSESCQKIYSNCEEVAEDITGELCNGHPKPTEWQLKTLRAQIDTVRELFDMEKDSKWAMLILGRLLVAYDELVGSSHMDEVQQLYKGLMKTDPIHANYYDQQLSLLSFKKVTSSMTITWWDCQNSNSISGAWLRLNCMSLSKLGYFEQLTWVQRLDLSNNRLQSLEGIQTLQLLVNLDVSRNNLSSVTALSPISFLPNLEALNVQFNHIGACKIDTNRYFISSALNNSVKRDPSRRLEHPFCWQLLEVFSGMGLRQLDMWGNPIANDDSCRCQIIEALPCLVWLDGVRVSG